MVTSKIAAGIVIGISLTPNDLPLVNHHSSSGGQVCCRYNVELQHSWGIPRYQQLSNMVLSLVLVTWLRMTAHLDEPLEDLLR